tara:strand:+ start:215465 stop:216322 length:858 start_codon:yes stop_codon:yes gene_type:complete
LIFVKLLSWLPFPALYGVSWLAYLIIYRVAGYRKGVVLDNLRHAFPDRSEKEITLLAKKFYRRFAQVALEIIKARRMSKADFLQRVQVVNPELVRAASNDSSRSVIIVTIHQGNWEWMLHGVTAALGVPLAPVYKPLHNKGFNQLMLDVRSRFGSTPVAMDRASRDILRRRREFRLFVMVADQSPIRSERSHWTTFMHRPAAFYLGAETLARSTGFPVVFAQCRRRSTGHYEVEFHRLAEPPYVDDGHAVTERYVALAEQAIRSEPESWLWTNRRWKRSQPETAG